METIALGMITGTFVVGMLLVGAGVLALLRRSASKAGGGTFKALGIEVTGSNGAALLLVIGAAFVASGFGWASTRTEAEDARKEIAKADAQVQELATTTATLQQQVKELAPPERLRTLGPVLDVKRTWHPPQGMKLAPKRPG